MSPPPLTDGDKRTVGTFVRALTGATTTPCTFQVFDDGGQKRSELAAVHHGSLAAVGRLLAAANAGGCGVFVCVAETDLRGRRLANIRQVRALFVDCDGFEPAAWHLPPSIVVRSGGGMHGYWLVDDCKLDEFRDAQKRLAAHYGSDPRVHDLPRVMRVPGFWHCKGAPKPVTLLDASGTVHTTDQVLDGTPHVEVPRPPRPRFVRLDWGVFDVAAVFRDAGMYRRHLGGDKHAVVCPWESTHTVPDWTSTSNTSTVVWLGPPQTFLCAHAHCDGRTLHDALHALGLESPGDRDRAKALDAKAAHAAAHAAAKLQGTP